MKKRAILVLFTLCFALFTNAQYISLDQLISLKNYSVSDLEDFLTSRNWTFVDADKETNVKMGSASFAFGRDNYQTDKVVLFINYMYSSTSGNKRLSYQLHKPTEYNKLVSRAKQLGFTLYKSIIQDNEIINVYKKGIQILRFKSAKDFQDYKNVTLYSVLILSYDEYSLFPEEYTSKNNKIPNISSWDKNSLKKQKEIIDSFYSQNENYVTVWIKSPENNELIEIEHKEEYEGEIETTYVILKNKEGKIIEIVEIPYSISGDWYIEYTHYFDQNGKTFAFTRQTNFFNSGCTENVAYETISEYYNNEFKLITKEYKLVDKNDMPLNKSKCDFLYDRPYKRESNLQSLKKRLHIKN